MSETRLSTVLGSAYHAFARDVFQHGHTHYDLSGGRGSLKSSGVSLLVPLLLVSNPGTTPWCCARWGIPFGTACSLNISGQ